MIIIVIIIMIIIIPGRRLELPSLIFGVPGILDLSFKFPALVNLIFEVLGI